MRHRAPTARAGERLPSVDSSIVPPGPPGVQPTAASRWRANLPLLVTGGAAIIAGGLVAAVTGPTGWDHGSWVAAFLVLVTGVAQIGVGAAQAQIARTAPTVAYVATECGVWNGSCIVVIAGTLLSSPATVTAGSALLLVALGMSASAVRQSGRSSLLRLYRTLLIGLLASTPIGIALAWARR